MCTKVALAYNKILSQYSPGGNEENHKRTLNSWYPSQDSNWTPSGYKVGSITTCIMLLDAENAWSFTPTSTTYTPSRHGAQAQGPLAQEHQNIKVKGKKVKLPL
jgi:hypothetical protein